MRLEGVTQRVVGSTAELAELSEPPLKMVRLTLSLALPLTLPPTLTLS